MLCVYSTFETSCWLDRTGSGLQITSLRKQPTFCGAIIVCCLVCSRIMTSVAPDWSYREEISLVITVNAIRITVGLTSDALTWNLSALSPKSLNRRRPAFYRLATSRPLGEQSEAFLAAKRPTASDEFEVARGRLVSIGGFRPVPYEIRRRRKSKHFTGNQW